MVELSECLGCRRHVRSSDARCPFCDATGRAASPPTPGRLGVITRAALFYGASSIFGCAEPAEVPAPPPAPLGQAMVPNEQVEAPMLPEPNAEPAAVAIGPVELEPEAEDEAEAERAHAEDGKRDLETARVRRRRVVHRVNADDVRRIDEHRLAMPYGAPPVDFPIV